MKLLIPYYSVNEKDLLKKIQELEKRIKELEDAPEENHYYWPVQPIPMPYTAPNVPTPYWAPGWPTGPTFTCSTSGRR